MSTEAGEQPGRPDEGPWRRRPLPGVLGATVATVAGGLILYILLGGDDNGNGGEPPPPPPPAAQISAPIGGNEVASSFVARGSVSNVPRGDAVWLVVQRGGLAPGSPRVVFPVARIEAPVSGERAWRHRVSPADLSLEGAFSLALLRVGSEGQRRITDWLTGSRKQGIVGLAHEELDEVEDLQLRLCAHDPIRTATVGGTADITSAESDQAVGRALNPVVGRYELGSGSRAKVWVFVYSVVTDRFYQQTHRDARTFEGDLSAALLSGGRFRSSAAFGGRPGEEYELVAVLADPAASRALSRTLRRWARTGDFAGLTAEQLPAGLEEKECLPVHLRG